MSKIAPAVVPDFDYAKPLTELKAVSPVIAKKLAKCGLTVMRDLLFHWPIRYEDRTKITPICHARHSSYVLIEGKIIHVQRSTGRRKFLQVVLADQQAVIHLNFFHFSSFHLQTLTVGQQLRCYGQIKQSGGELSMVHPEFEKITSDHIVPVAAFLTPVYPLTQGLSQSVLRRMISHAVAKFCASQPTELLPELLTEKLHLWPIAQVLSFIHAPEPGTPVNELLEKSHPAFQRLVVEETLTHKFSLKVMRTELLQSKAYPLLAPPDLLAKFYAQLGFHLTGAQQRVLTEICHDLGQAQPMLRLVQGDVGSGKTVVAAIACLMAIGQGKQAALMAPTELLAEQHYQNFKSWFMPLGITVVFISGKQKKSERTLNLAQLNTQTPLMVIGTHALFQDSMIFKDLALSVIDEQHRFGVHQRLQLRDKGQYYVPHQLIMTATPIPRTLAMTHYANLELSVIDELPPGRKPITTLALPQDRREAVIERMRKVCLNHQQIYWVCPLIEESEKLECQAAETQATYLRDMLPELNVGLVHGRMPAADKAQVMQAFYQAQVDILVATTVIEVGVNVPSASLMVINNPERLGLAQLHQLRGRVGRGASASFCVLLYQGPLSYQAKARLDILRQTQDGFVIAEKDLQLRGAGEVLGTRQTGVKLFKILDFNRDRLVIEQLTELTQKFSLTEQHIKLLQQRWLGQANRYGSV